MTELSAQPVTLTGEQHQEFWDIAKELREVGLKVFADRIEATLIAAHEAGGSALQPAAE